MNDVKIVVEFAVAALIAIGILVGILIGIQADMCRKLYEVLDENISIRKVMIKQYVAIKLLLKKNYEIDMDDYYDNNDNLIQSNESLNNKKENQ